MNNTLVLDQLYGLANCLSGSDKDVYNMCRDAGGIAADACALVYGKEEGVLGMKLFEFISAVEKDYKECAYAKGGKKKILASAKRILANVEDHMPGLKGVIESNGRYILCDSFRIVAFNDDLPLPRAEESTIVNTINKILESAENTADAKNIAEACEGVRSYIIEEKARRKMQAIRRGERITYDIPGTDIRVNAQFLVDMLDALPGCEVYPAYENATRGMVFFKGENGIGVLLPILKI